MRKKLEVPTPTSTKLWQQATIGKKIAAQHHRTICILSYCVPPPQPKDEKTPWAIDMSIISRISEVLKAEEHLRYLEVGWWVGGLGLLACCGCWWVVVLSSSAS